MREPFKNARRIHTEFMVIRYLISNTYGRENWAEKAQRHSEMCSFYVAVMLGCSPDEAVQLYPEEYWTVHEVTQELTDFMDERIGFPLDSRSPDYDKLAFMFFEQFDKLAMSVFKEK